MRRALCLGALLIATACGGSSDGAGGRVLAERLGFSADIGSICGDPRILGREIGRVSAPGACGIEDAVRVHAVGDVVLTPSARVNCKTARALKAWVDGAAQPAARAAGTRIEGMRVAASYACRTRNSRRGARISEHAKGNAIDISRFDFANGDSATVLGDWSKGRYSKTLRRLHSSACGPFGTVLGPNADRHHQDHFHFDVASYRNGTYCR